MSKLLNHIFAAALLLMPMTAQAQNNGLSTKSRTVVMLHVFAEKGLECDLLEPWEALTLKLQVLQERKTWDHARRHQVADVIKERLTDKACTDPGMKSWISASREGFHAEMLPPYLVMYRALAQMEQPPLAFERVTARLDYREPIARIEAKLAELEATGRNPEGNQSWPEYQAGLEGFLTEALQAQEAGEKPSSRKARQALELIGSAALVVETWLEDTVTSQ